MDVIFNRDRTHTLDRKVAIALGSFDGIHKGHRQLIQALNDIKSQKGCLTMVYTFREHPLNIISPSNTPGQITNNAQKAQLLEELGIDYLVFNDFTPEFSMASPEEFVSKYLVDRYQVDTIVIGYNYRFGEKGRGDIGTMIELGNNMGFTVEVIPPIKLQGNVISSSTIRSLIEDGHVYKAAQFLGYPYTLTGRVVRGYGRGRHLGFPTANLEYENMAVIPGHGVYLTLCTVKDMYMWGLTNVGTNPTFDHEEVCVETHIVGYSGDLYSEEMNISFIEKIRDEVRFDNSDELVKQMQQDMSIGKKYIYKIIQMCYNT